RQICHFFFSEVVPLCKRADERIRLTTRTGRPTGELEDAAASAGILRPESARFNFEFLHSLPGRSCGDRTSILDHGRGAIHHNLFAEGAYLLFAMGQPY